LAFPFFEQTALSTGEAEGEIDEDEDDEEHEGKKSTTRNLAWFY